MKNNTQALVGMQKGIGLISCMGRTVNRVVAGKWAFMEAMCFAIIYMIIITYISLNYDW